MRNCRLERERGGLNEPVLIVFMSKVLGGGICDALSHTREDRELSLRQMFKHRSLGQFLIKHALCKNKRALCETFQSRGDRTMVQIGCLAILHVMAVLLKM